MRCCLLKHHRPQVRVCVCVCLCVRARMYCVCVCARVKALRTYRVCLGCSEVRISEGIKTLETVNV